MNDKEYTYVIDKYTIGVDTNGYTYITKEVDQMSKEDIMLLNNLINKKVVTLDSEEVKALGEKISLIVSQITTQEALNDIMLKLNKLNAPEENK